MTQVTAKETGVRRKQEPTTAMTTWWWCKEQIDNDQDVGLVAKWFEVGHLRPSLYARLQGLTMPILGATIIMVSVKLKKCRHYHNNAWGVKSVTTSQPIRKEGKEVKKLPVCLKDSSFQTCYQPVNPNTCSQVPFTCWKVNFSYVNCLLSFGMWHQECAWLKILQA